MYAASIVFVTFVCMIDVKNYHLVSAFPVVNTDCGLLEGYVDKVTKLPVFKGIPYAKTSQRWKHPESLHESGQCWNGTLNATTYGLPCVQFFKPYPGLEDCLSLSVWSSQYPLNLSSVNPVMVFFHGGDLTLGTGTTNFALLAARGLVVVEVRYRLNALGFLSLKAFADLDQRGTSGNYGFLDQLEALRWIQRNIAAFGGDKSKVTIFGQSSGGTSVICLMASPKSKGLFHRAMSLSGSPNITSSLIRQQKEHAHIAMTLGCNMTSSHDILSCLRQKSIHSLLRAVPAGPDHGPDTITNPSWTMGNIFDIPRFQDGLRMPTLAVADGVTIAKPPIDAYKEGLIDVPFIISNMAQEPGEFPGNNFNATDMTLDQFEAQLSLDLDHNFGVGFAHALIALYEPAISIDPQKLYDSIAADIEVTCGNLQLASAAARGFKNPVYSILNSIHGDDQRKWAYHGKDLQYAISDIGRQGQRIRDWWFEFADTGEVSEWTKANSNFPTSSYTTNLLENDAVHAYPEFKSKICLLWKSHGAGSEFWWSN